METLRIEIDGMSCGHCVARVEKALRARPEVASVEVEIGEARVQGEPGALDPGPLEAAIREAGFEPHAASGG
jgi:copper chaperone CopZ